MSLSTGFINYRGIWVLDAEPLYFPNSARLRKDFPMVGTDCDEWGSGKYFDKP